MLHLHTIKIKRMAAGIVAFLMLFIILFSAALIAAEADHDCTGEDCPICACIAQCEDPLNQIGDVLAVQTAVILPVFFMLILACLLADNFTQETPYSRKVRLNN